MGSGDEYRAMKSRYVKIAKKVVEPHRMLLDAAEAALSKARALEEGNPEDELAKELRAEVSRCADIGRQFKGIHDLLVDAVEALNAKAKGSEDDCINEVDIPHADTEE